MLRFQPHLENHVYSQRLAWLCQVCQAGVKPEQAQVCLFIQLAAFVGIQKAAVDILGCVADVRWK